MERKLIYRFFLLAVAVTFLFVLLMRARSLSAATQGGRQVAVKVTGTFALGGTQYVRFIDPETKALCYAQTNTGAIACIKQ